MIETSLVSLIGTLGFPIAVCVFLLMERSKTTKELIRVIQDLSLLIKTKLK